MFSDLWDARRPRKSSGPPRQSYFWFYPLQLLEAMQITVKLLSGKKAQIDIESTDTIRRIKERVEEKVRFFVLIGALSIDEYNSLTYSHADFDLALLLPSSCCPLPCLFISVYYYSMTLTSLY